MKKILGLILELNPLHNGHKYFIEEAKKKVNPDIVIAVISTNFSMRGDIMVIPKFDKINLALDLGIDLIIENPVLGAVNSADLFCFNSIKMLTELNVTDISFGVELDNLEKLKEMVKLLKSPLYNELMKKYLSLGHSYQGSSLNAIREITSDEEIIKNFSLPNNTLAIQYLKALEELNLNTNITLIKRIENNYYDEEATSSISSATSLRNLLMANKEITDFIPKYNPNFINLNEAYEKLFTIIKYKFSVEEIDNFKNILGVTEGIEKRIVAFLNEANDYEDLIKKVQTKRYPINKIKRLLLNILLEVPNNLDQPIDYLRILGMNKTGKDYLSSRSKETKNKLLSTIKYHLDDINLQFELKSSKLYGILIGNKNFYHEEFKLPIVRG